ncbi:MAG: hypothetical protein LN568_05565 [Rickettsia endosymbiont of Pseudomimeciton antennatum]|nr:hypothetical protein [Rickettsia endosymbiont of Pseudomimeciton antennatum]
MIKRKRLIITIVGLLLLSSNSIANATSPTTSNVNKTTVNNDNELQKIIDEFSSYAAGISAELREEIKKYRIEVAKINNHKRELYKKISQEAQNYFAKEREYKKRISSLRKNSAEIPKSTDKK